jgi:mRNA interferase MazF
MKYKRFEVWLADLNPRFGTEAGKTRPVLIVQSDLLNKVHLSTIICPITTNIRTEVNILRINLDQGTAGLNKDSAIMMDQVRAIDNKRFIRKLGTLPADKQQLVQDNLRIVLDLM